MAVIINEFQLDQFHGGHPLRVLDLGAGLNVALVRDAVGRAQLLRVAPWFFYGPSEFFPHVDGSETIDSIAPGTGGSMKLRTDHGVFHLERSWNGEQASVRLTGSGGKEYEPEYLATILERLPVNTYREVLTFDLARMTQIVNGNSHDRLARLATYLKNKSPQPVGAAVVENPRDLGVLNSRLGELTRMLNVSANLDQVAGDDQELPRRDRDKLHRELKKLDKELADSQAKLHSLQAEIDQTQCAIAISSVQNRLDDVNRDLSDARSAKRQDVATGSREAAERLDHKIAACKEELQEFKTEYEDIKRQGKELGDVSRMTQLVPQIDALLMQEKSLIKEEAAIDQMTGKLQDFESRLDSERMASSHSTSFAPTTSVVDNHAANRVDSLTQRLRDAERDIQVAEERLMRAEASGTLAAEGMLHASSLATHPEDAVAIHDAEQRVADLQQLMGLDDQRHRLDAEYEDLQIQLKRLLANQLMPFRMMMALGVPFMIGVAMIIYGLLMSGSSANWQLILLGFIAALATTMIKLSIDNRTDEVLRATRRRLSNVNYQLEEIFAANDATAASGVSLTRQIEDAQRHLNHLTTKFTSREPTMTSEPAVASSSLETARMHLNESRRRQAEVNQQWRDLMIELGLSPNLTAVHAKEALASRSMQTTSVKNDNEKRGLEMQIQHLRMDIDRRNDWLNTMTGQASQLIKQVGAPIAGATVGEQMDILRESMSEHKDRMQARRQLQRTMKRIKEKIRRTNEKGRQLSDQRSKLNEELTLKKQQQKSQEQLRKDRVKDLEHERDRLKEEIGEARNRFRIDGDFSMADSDDDLVARLEDLTGNLDRLLERLMRKSEKRGRCKAQLSMTDGNKSRIAWEAMIQKTKEIAQECQLTESQTVLVGDFEYLKLASRFLGHLTNGQLVRIEVPRDQHMVVIDQRGKVLELKQVRPEHYANIYFSLWLARLEAYADAGLRLPIVVEDPVAATDADSKPIVATLLCDFAAKGHQVFLVTSQSQTADLFAQLDVPIADLSENLERVAVTAEPTSITADEITVDRVEPYHIAEREPIEPDQPTRQPVATDGPLFPPLG